MPKQLDVQRKSLEGHSYLLTAQLFKSSEKFSRYSDTKWFCDVKTLQLDNLSVCMKNNGFKDPFHTSTTFTEDGIDLLHKDDFTACNDEILYHIDGILSIVLNNKNNVIEYTIERQMTYILLQLARQLQSLEKTSKLHLFLIQEDIISRFKQLILLLKSSVTSTHDDFMLAFAQVIFILLNGPWKNEYLDSCVLELILISLKPMHQGHPIISKKREIDPKEIGKIMRSSKRTCLKRRRCKCLNWKSSDIEKLNFTSTCKVIPNGLGKATGFSKSRQIEEKNLFSSLYIDVQTDVRCTFGKSFRNFAGLSNINIHPTDAFAVILANVIEYEQQTTTLSHNNQGNTGQTKSSTVVYIEEIEAFGGLLKIVEIVKNSTSDNWSAKENFIRVRLLLHILDYAVSQSTIAQRSLANCKLIFQVLLKLSADLCETICRAPCVEHSVYLEATLLAALRILVSLTHLNMSAETNMLEQNGLPTLLMAFYKLEMVCRSGIRDEYLNYDIYILLFSIMINCVEYSHQNRENLLHSDGSTSLPVIKLLKSYFLRKRQDYLSHKKTLEQDIFNQDAIASTGISERVIYDAVLCGYTALFMGCIMKGASNNFCNEIMYDLHYSSGDALSSAIFVFMDIYSFFGNLSIDLQKSAHEVIELLQSYTMQ